MEGGAGYKLTVKVSDEDASSKGFFLIVNHNFIAEYVCMCVCTGITKHMVS